MAFQRRCTVYFTETWLKKEDQDEKIPNYVTFRGDRKGGKTKGGGVAIYIKDGFEGKVLLEDYVENKHHKYSSL